MIELILEPIIKDRLWRHLLPNPHRLEEAAFLLANVEQGPYGWAVVGRDILFVTGDDYAVQTSVHIELTQEVQSRAIRSAHQSNLCLIEFHSHTGKWPAEFSISDRSGFNDWVPHVRWRLKGSPYGAVVVTSNSFDGLLWRGDGVERIDRIRSEVDVRTANALTKLEWPFIDTIDSKLGSQGVGNED